MSTDSEIRGLARIRFRRAVFLCTLALLAPLAAAFHLLPGIALQLKSLLLGWCGLYAAATLWCVFSRCPRCAHLFHSVHPHDNPLARSCRGCGLSLREHRLTVDPHGR